MDGVERVQSEIQNERLTLCASGHVCGSMIFLFVLLILCMCMLSLLTPAVCHRSGNKTDS